MNSGGRRSGRVERICPSFANVGPSSSSALRTRLAWRRRPVVPSSSGRPNSSFSPYFAKTAAIFVPRATSRGSVSSSTAELRMTVTERIADRRVPIPARRVHDDHGAARVVVDPVRDVAEEELLASGHAGVPDHQHVDRVVVGRVHDGHRRVIVDDDVRPASLAGQAEGFDLESVGGRVRARGLGRAELRVGRARRHDHLHQVQFRAVALGEGDRPVHRSWPSVSRRWPP